MSYEPEYGERTFDEWLRCEAAFIGTTLGVTFGQEEVREWNDMEEERGALFEEFPYLF